MTTNTKRLLHNPFIRVNEERVDVSARGLLAGHFHLEEGACSEQCECGENIAETGCLSRDRLHVVCDCGAKYEIIESLR